MHLLIVYLKGLCMGAADVVPGVSGGTVAFITGIYERLLTCIAHVDTQLVRLVLRGKFLEAWRYLDAGFLLALLLGIASSFLLLARVVLYAMEHFSVLFWAGMAGLILASTVLVWRQLKTWRWAYVVPLVLGLLTAYGISVATPGESPTDLWFIFLSGMVAICAMILPGISGSFILVLLGKYEYMMLALKELQMVTIIVFIAGCAVGILSFARVLKFLFARFHDWTVMAMAGFMLGSLVKLWPWKQVLSTYTNSKGEVVPLAEANILPDAYARLGMDPQVLQVILVFVVAFGFVLALELTASRQKKVTVIRA